MRLKLLAVGASVAAGIWLLAPGVSAAGVSHGHGIPRYNHIVEIMMENTSFSTIIGNPLAPDINALASKYGLATDYFGVTHPSEPNYVSNIGAASSASKTTTSSTAPRPWPPPTRTARGQR